MKFKNIGTGSIFNLDNTPTYPKLKVKNGYVDMRDEIVNLDPNQAVLSAKITLMGISELREVFKDESDDELINWISDIKEKYKHLF